MKTTILFRIVLWALVALVLTAALVYLLAGGQFFPAGTKSAAVVSTPEQSVPSSREAPTVFSDVTRLEIHWISGGVTLESGAEENTFSEDFQGDAAYRMSWQISGDTLVIHDFPDETSTLLNLDLPSKQLHVSLCAPMEQIKIVTSSAEVELVGEVQTDHLNVSTVSGNVCGALLRADTLHVETVSGDISLRVADCTAAELNTTSGELELMCERTPETIELETLSGNAVLMLPAQSVHTLNWSTVSGEFYDHTDTTGGFGSADRAVHITAGSVSGDLTLQTAEKQEDS